jgi:hypothetical protein
MRDLRILPEVAEDLSDAANWYDEKGYPGLGDRFIETFYSYIPHILDRGEIHRIVYSDFRKILLQPFPYLLFYRYQDDFVIITSVMSAVRKPSLIRRVLKERS